MEKIEGINLAEIIKEMQDSIFNEKRNKIKKQIQGILIDMESWKFQIKESEKGIISLNEKIQKAQGKLTEMSKENWNIINEFKLDTEV